MKRISFLIAGLLSTAPLFCANMDQIKPYVDEKGVIHPCLSQKNLESSDLQVLCALSNCMSDHMSYPAILASYQKGLMRIDTVFLAAYGLMLSTVHKNPDLVEHMLYEYIPVQEEPVLYAMLATYVGGAYGIRHRFHDAQRMYTESLRVVPNASSTLGLMNTHHAQNNLQASAYWLEQHKQRGFIEDVHIKPNALEILHQRSNEQTDQKRSPEEFLAYARAYQPENPNERALVEKYNDIFKKDPA